MDDERTIAQRWFDRIFGVLLRPRVRRVRRWAFLVTIPTGLLVGDALGLRPSLESGVALAIAVAVLDACVLVAVILVGSRVLGRERRDALLDLLMHPTARRLVAGEARLLAMVPRALWRAATRRRPRPGEFAQPAAGSELGFALALLPAMVAEGAAVHLLLPESWTVVRIAAALLHVYAILIVLGLALGPRVLPHRLERGELVVRLGALTRVVVPVEAIVAAEPAAAGRRGGVTRVELGDGAATLRCGGRVDVRLLLREPVEVERPLGDPVAVRELTFAAARPADLLAALAGERERVRQLPVGPRTGARLRDLAGPAALADALTA